MLLVKTGGKIAYASQAARQLFALDGQEPDLESLARRLSPQDAFLGLCAAEGQASFSLRGQPLDGVSYRVPLDGAPALLVTLRRPALATEESAGASRSLDRFLQLSQAINLNLDLEATLKAILEQVAGLLPADYLEITVWQADEKRLAPYRLASAGEDRRLEKTSERYSAERGYTGLLFSERQPLLIRDKDALPCENPQVEAKSYPFAAFLGLPLLVEGNPVGTLELASLTPDAYSEKDVQVLRLVADQAAVAVQHAVLYRQGERRLQESAALAQLTAAVSALRSPEELFTRLIETIHPLLEVEALGFLLYDEERRILEGKYPFIGVQPTMLSWARFPIPPGSEAESIWLAQVTITSQEAQSDERLRLFGLDLLAVTAGIQSCALEPLLSGERMLGYLLAGDKRDGTAFTPGDLQLLRIVAAQVSPLIENAALVQQSNRRAQRAETLRRIASLIGSTATLDEVLKYSLQDAARLLAAERAAIFLLDENRGALRLHSDSLFGISPELALQIGQLTHRRPAVPPDDHRATSSLPERRRPRGYRAAAGLQPHGAPDGHPRPDDRAAHRARARHRRAGLRQPEARSFPQRRRADHQHRRRSARRRHPADAPLLSNRRKPAPARRPAHLAHPHQPRAEQHPGPAAPAAARLRRDHPDHIRRLRGDPLIRAGRSSLPTRRRSCSSSATPTPPRSALPSRR